MKKNKMMRLASALLVMTLLTTSIISGTFAKYTTSDSATDSARVAKWGAMISATGSLFADSYKDTPETGDTATVVAYNRSVSGTIKDGDDIVAPGTKNDTGIFFGLTGTPEVSSKVTVTVEKPEDPATEDADYSNIWLKDGVYGVMVAVNDTIGHDVNGYYTESNGVYTKIIGETIGAEGTKYYEAVQIVNLNDNNYTANDARYENGAYYPIIWKYKIGDEIKTVNLLAELDSALTAINGADNYVYKPNTDLTNVTNSDFTITWEWPFEVKNGDVVDAVVDGCDTVLGHLMAGQEVVAIGQDGVTVLVEDSNSVSGVTYYKNGNNRVACLTAAYNVKMTLEQVD